MAAKFTDSDWQYLVELVRQGDCTPFIGAGASAGAIPTGSELSREWADKWNYPFSDALDLARVAQYLAVIMDGMFPKKQIQRLFGQTPPPDFSDPHEPHVALAKLELPIYITTNYDNFMGLALESLGKEYQRDFCRWNDAEELRKVPNVFDNGYSPSPEEPLVYHLHGYYELPRSLVLTESDYLEFLIKFARKPDFLPSPIMTALSGTALLFAGYSLNDFNFRVLFRAINSAIPRNLQYRSVAIQLPSSDWEQWNKDDAVRYLQNHLERIHNKQVRIFWGDFRMFMAELVTWWRANP